MSVPTAGRININIRAPAALFYNHLFLRYDNTRFSQRKRARFSIATPLLLLISFAQMWYPCQNASGMANYHTCQSLEPVMPEITPHISGTATTIKTHIKTHVEAHTTVHRSFSRSC
jgi:hypothetical protein